MSEISKEKVQGSVVEDPRESLKNTVKNLEQLLGKPYIKRKRRKKYPGETEEQRAKRLETAKIRLALSLQSMSKKEKEERLKRMRLLSKLRQAHETPEERAERLASKRLRFHNLSPDKKAARYKQTKARTAFLRAIETPEQREERNRKLRQRTVNAKRRQRNREKAREKARNMSETEKEALKVRRRARDKARRKRVALERQKMQEKQKMDGAPVNQSETRKYSGPVRYFLISEITIEPPDVPDNSFYDYVYNEIQPLMIHFSGNQQFFKDRLVIN